MKKRIIAVLAVLLTSCSALPVQGEPVQKDTTVMTTTAETTVTTTEATETSKTTTEAVTEAQAETDVRSLYNSITVCGHDFSLPLRLDDLTGDFAYKEEESENIAAYKFYTIYYGNDEIGYIALNEDGSTESFAFYGHSYYSIGGFDQYGSTKELEECFGKPDEKMLSFILYRYDDMTATFWCYLDDKNKEVVDHFDIIYGDFSDKSDKFLLEKEIQEMTDGETSADLEGIHSDIIVDGVEFPAFPFSEKKLPSDFEIKEYIDSEALFYKDKRIADIVVTRGSVVYLGFYAQSMEDLDISVGGIKYDTSDEDILALLGDPNCTLSTDDTLVYISGDRGLAVHTSGYNKSYSTDPGTTDSNYVSVGISGRKKFNS